MRPYQSAFAQAHGDDDVFTSYQTASGDFSDPSLLVYLPVTRGRLDTYSTLSLYAALKSRDVDGLVYWRVEDAGTASTSIEPSEPNSMVVE